jgi:cell division protein FtsQ
MSKKWVIRLLISGVTTFVVLAAIIGHGYRKCTALNIIVDYDSASVFVTPEEVKAHLVKMFGDPVGQRLKEINVQSIESMLQTNPFICEAQANLSLSGELNVEIKQKKPILRVFNAKGQQYYLTDKGQMMPISEHGTQRTPIATGDIFDYYSSMRNLESENSAIEDSLLNRSVLFRLWFLEKKIKSDPFMDAQVDQIFVTNKGEFELVSRVGGQLIVVGNIDNLEKKFTKLKALYTESFSQTGWSKYAIINLKFKNQVVCTKK